MSAPDVKRIQIKDVVFGKNVTIVEPVNLYGCTIGDHTFIGPFVEIQNGATVGSHCKIQSHTLICEMVTIGNHCFISHGVMFINDSFRSGGPAGGDKKLWRPTRIGDHVSIGTNATILPVTVTCRVVVGAGSVVTKDLLAPGIYAGNPAKLLRLF